MFVQSVTVGVLACCVTVADAQPVTEEPAAEAPREAPEAPPSLESPPEPPPSSEQSATAPPPQSVEPTSDSATTSPRGCKVRVFLEPSLHVVALSYTDRPYFLSQHRIAGSTVIGRFRGGVHLDGCTGRADVRAAASLMVTNMPKLGDQYGFGGDVEVGLPLVEHWTLGPRVGVETPSPTIHVSAGVRLRYKRAVWFGIDIFHSRATQDSSLTYMPRCADEQIQDCVANVTGITIGAGYGGIPGVVTGGVAVTLLGLAVAAFAGASR